MIIEGISFRIFCLALCCVAAGCSHSSNTYDYSSGIGTVVLRGDGNICLVIKNAHLSGGTEFSVIFPSMPGSPVKAEYFKAKVVSRNTSLSGTDQNTETGDGWYAIEIIDGMLITEAPYIAVFMPVEKLAFRGNDIVCDLDQDGTQESFRQCTGTKGVHLTVWSGEPFKGKRRWHRYYYLGYDVEPSCVD